MDDYSFVKREKNGKDYYLTHIDKRKGCWRVVWTTNVKEAIQVDTALAVFLAKLVGEPLEDKRTVTVEHKKVDT